jgi:hypothetical protein
MNALLVCLTLTLLSAAPRTQLEDDVASLTLATERFETARAAVAAAETKLATERVILRGARAALWAAIRRVQEDLGEVAPEPRPVVYTPPVRYSTTPYYSAPACAPCPTWNPSIQQWVW